MSRDGFPFKDPIGIHVMLRFLLYESIYRGSDLVVYNRTSRHQADIIGGLNKRFMATIGNVRSCGAIGERAPRYERRIAILLPLTRDEPIVNGSVKRRALAPQISLNISSLM